MTLSTSTTAPHRPSPSPRAPNAAPITHTINDAARITGLSRSTLYRHEKAGHLRLVRVGGRTLVDAVSLRALVGVEA